MSSGRDVSHHRVTEDWLGKPTQTLADLLRPGLRVVCIGINPAPRSVAAGHYYQGRLGQLFFRRLRKVGLLPDTVSAWEDDIAFANGTGFTDVVKRPTPSADDVSNDEFEHGRPLLLAKLVEHRPKVVIFTFKLAAERVIGKIDGCGFVATSRLGDADVFVMPGPYAPRALVEGKLIELQRRLS